MTNAEKAQELVSNPANDYKSTEDLCWMMAEWKEQQMIERAVEWLKTNAGKYIKGSLSASNYCTEHCIDDFKEAMKEAI